MIMNMKNMSGEARISEFMKILGAPFRIQILYSIGYGEACVCHLEALLKRRQAYISQHLSVLRDAGILETRRDGKFIYYRVADRSLFEILDAASELLNIPDNIKPNISRKPDSTRCDCPNCQKDTTLTIH